MFSMDIHTKRRKSEEQSMMLPSELLVAIAELSDPYSTLSSLGAVSKAMRKVVLDQVISIGGDDFPLIPGLLMGTQLRNVSSIKLQLCFSFNLSRREKSMFDLVLRKLKARKQKLSRALANHVPEEWLPSLEAVLIDARPIIELEETSDMYEDLFRVVIQLAAHQLKELRCYAAMVKRLPKLPVLRRLEFVDTPATVRQLKDLNVKAPNVRYLALDTEQLGELEDYQLPPLSNLPHLELLDFNHFVPTPTDLAGEPLSYLSLTRFAASRPTTTRIVYPKIGLDQRTLVALIQSTYSALPLDDHRAKSLLLNGLYPAHYVALDFLCLAADNRSEDKSALLWWISQPEASLKSLVFKDECGSSSIMNNLSLMVTDRELLQTLLDAVTPAIATSALSEGLEPDYQILPVIAEKCGLDVAKSVLDKACGGGGGEKKIAPSRKAMSQVGSKVSWRARIITHRPNESASDIFEIGRLVCERSDFRHAGDFVIGAAIYFGESIEALFEYLSTKHFPSVADLFSTDEKLFECLVRPVVQNCDQLVCYTSWYKVFLSVGIDISPVHPRTGKTPLIYLAERNYWYATHRLARMVPNNKLNIADRRGNTAAHYYAATLTKKSMTYVVLAKTLAYFRRHTDLTLRNNDGKTIDDILPMVPGELDASDDDNG